MKMKLRMSTRMKRRSIDILGVGTKLMAMAIIHNVSIISICNTPIIITTNYTMAIITRAMIGIRMRSKMKRW